MTIHPRDTLMNQPVGTFTGILRVWIQDRLTVSEMRDMAQHICDDARRKEKGEVG